MCLQPTVIDSLSMLGRRRLPRSRVDHRSLFTTVQRRGVGSRLISWVLTWNTTNQAVFPLSLRTISLGIESLGLLGIPVESVPSESRVNPMSPWYLWVPIGVLNPSESPVNPRLEDLGPLRETAAFLGGHVHQAPKPTQCLTELGKGLTSLPTMLRPPFQEAWLTSMGRNPQTPKNPGNIEGPW